MMSSSLGILLIVGAIALIVVLVAIIAIAVQLTRSGRSKPGVAHDARAQAEPVQGTVPDAGVSERELIDQRLARNEITAQEHARLVREHEERTRA